MKNTKKFLAVSCLSLAAAFAVTGFASCKSNEEKAADAIAVVTREDGSGTKSAFMEIIGLKGAPDKPGVTTASSMQAVLTEVAGNPNAIAYDSLGYVNDSVKILTVEGVAPTAETIKDGSYKISRPLNVVYQASTIESSELFGSYLNFLQSTQAQTIISENGYVSVKEGATEYSVNAALSGNIKISGSTSLQPLMVKLADKFMEMQSGVTVEVSGGGSGTGYKNANNGTSDFGMISEEFKSSKADKCTYYTVAKDGIAMIVNKSNKKDDISIIELRRIYGAPIEKWSDMQ